MNARTTLVALVALILATATVLAGCATDATARGTVVPPAATEIAPYAVGGGDPPNDQLDTVPGMAKFGEQVEIRPGLFVVVTAQALTLSVGETGAKAPHVRTVITYDNRTDKVMQGMGTMLAFGSVADLDGNVFAFAMPAYDPKTGKSTVDTHQVGNVFPGRTGTVAELWAPSAAWAPDQEIAVTVRRPALAGEDPVGLFGSSDVMAVGVATRK